MAIKKLLELKGDDWMKGLSSQTLHPVGGIFRQATNFDPFELMGYLRPAAAPNDFTTATLAKTPKFCVSFDGGTPLIYVYSALASTADLYEIDTLALTITDRTSRITTTATARGATSYKGNFVYAFDTAVRAVPMPVASGADTSILASGVNAAQHPFTLGADLNLYFANGPSIGKITNVAGTTGNTGNVFSLESTMTIRDLRSDGRYLVFIADDRNASSSNVGSVNCVIAFWDYFSGTLTQRYDFKDTGMIAMEVLDGNSYVFGYDAMYVCNVVTSPKIIMPFRGNFATITARPTGPQTVTRKGNSIIWGDSASAKIFGYGSLVAGQPKIFYQPFTGTLGNTSSVFYNGFTLFLFTDTPKAYTLNSTKDQMNVFLTDIKLDRPYKLSYVRVVTKDPLASGQSVTLQINSQNGSGLILISSAFSFTNDGAKTTKIFTPATGGSGGTEVFNEISLFNIATVGSVTVESISLYGEEANPQDQSI